MRKVKSNRYKITKSRFAIGGCLIVEGSPVGQLITESVSWSGNQPSNGQVEGYAEDSQFLGRKASELEKGSDPSHLVKW